jgi:YVTN family beta-propeller protein
VRGPASFLAVVDTRLHAPVAAVAFGTDVRGHVVEQVVLAPDGRTAYVGSSVGLLVMDTATNMEVARVSEVRGGVNLVMAPDGRRLYVSGVVPGVQVVDLAANAVVASIDLPHASFPAGGAITPDGTSLYVTLNQSQAVGVVDTVTNSVATFIRVPAYPNRIAISPDGRTAYVAHDRPREFGTLSVIDTETESVIAIVGLDQPSNELAVTPDGKFIYLTNGRTGTVTVLETKTYQIVTIIPVGGNTGKIALATMPNGCMPVRACAGDCNLDRAVTVDEVLLGVNIALGNAFATACRAADADGDQEVSINELVSAVRFATEGCAGGPGGS